MEPSAKPSSAWGGMDYAQPQPGIYTLSLLSPAICKTVIARAHEKEAWQPARVSDHAGEGHGAVDTAVRSASVTAFEPGSAVWELLHEKVDTVVRPLVKARGRRDYPNHTPFQVVRYQPGGFYQAHRDAGLHFQERYYTVVFYLNDDFEGGGTHFPDHNYTVVPKQGKTLIFPANYLHQAEPILSGVKYVAVAWLTGRPPLRLKSL